MKPPRIAPLILVLSLLMLSACGQSGDLYLPESSRSASSSVS